MLVVLLGAAGVLTYYYVQFGHLIDQRLTGQVFQNTSSVYSAPGHIFTGETMHASDLKSYLLQAGYQEGNASAALGAIPRERLDGRDSSLRKFLLPRRATLCASISRARRFPTSRSFPTARPATPPRSSRCSSRIFSTARARSGAWCGSTIMPPLLVHAVLAAEDKRFFEHGALDLIRVFGAALADVRLGRKAQGASTIDMQVARTFFFTTKRDWRRKIKEVLMAAEIDERFSKQQIFELYANDVYLGNRGSFSIRGFGEAAEAYFGKDVHELTPGEAAFLGGIIRAPNYYSSAERHLDRADEARNRVLAQMVDDGYLTADQEAAAKKSKLKFVNGGLESSAAPYFVDMVKDHLLEKFSEADLETQSYRIYTTLDPDLQRAASQAVQIGSEEIDKLLARRYAIWRKKGEPVPTPQVALVAMDPHTGEILALVGGRDYGESQLNHALAHRQPGSVFKPFVYAAAFDNAVEGCSRS